MTTEFHAPVLLEECVRLLGGPGDVLDCTLGDGGHTAGFLESGASVVGIDRDPVAVRRAGERLAPHVRSGRLRLFNANFADLDEIPELAPVMFKGILLDLGVSSRQIDDESLGFTFRPGAPLDMRMGADREHDSTPDAASILNSGSSAELEQIFRDYSDEPRWRRLAAEVVRRRARALFSTSDDLVGAIRAVHGPRSGPSDFARVFQGVRIAVNNELASLSTALPRLRDRLIPSGALVVISYHSGEDRIVKNAFRDWTRGCICPPRQPVCTCGIEPMGETLTRRPVSAGEDEVNLNPRARSARLRAWRKKV